MATLVRPPVSLPLAMPGIPLARIVTLLRRFAWLIILLGLLGAVAAYGYARTLPKFYTASSMIAVSGNSFAIPELQGALRPDNVADPMPVVRTEMQALTSRDLVGQVVKQLDLASLPEFNPALRPPTAMAELKAWLQSFLPRSNEAGEPADSMEGVIGVVTQGIKIFQDNRSLAIDVGFISNDPERSARIANALVGTYLTMRAQRQSSANVGANQVITQRIDEVRGEIAGLETQIQTLRNNNDLVAVRAGSVSQQQLEDLVTAAAKASGDRGQLEATYSRAQAASAQGSPSELAGVLSSATISQLRDREAAASQKVAELSSRFGANYPAVVAAKADLQASHGQLAAETQRIVASIGTQLRIAREHEADVKTQLEAARRQAVGSEAARSQLKQLEDEVASRQKLYQLMLERAQQTSAQPSDKRLPDVYVISTAAAPIGPSGPNMKLATGFGGVAGGTLGCLIALLGLRVKARPGAGEAVAGLTILGTLPAGVLRRAKGGTTTAADRAMLARLDQLLREQVPGARPRAIGLASLTADANGAALADAWSQAALSRGDRVLVVEGNSNKPGADGAIPDDLLAALTGGPWPEAEDGPGLRRYAPAGPSPEIARLVASPVFANFIAHARERFDLVLLAAPAGTGPAVAAMLRQADASVLLVDAGRMGPGLTQGVTALAAETASPMFATMTGP